MTRPRRQPLFDRSTDRNTAPASPRNIAMLAQLRWVAVIGQVATILVASVFLHINLPLPPLLLVVVLLAFTNILTELSSRSGGSYSNLQLLASLLIDVQALQCQLYLTGGATNPLTLLFLLQIVIAAMLLPPRWAWVVAAVTCVDVVSLTVWHRPLPAPPAYDGDPFTLYLRVGAASFVLTAGLLAFFVARMDRKRRQSDAALAALRQQAAEEQLIIRMGLLATGAAHELGTPLSSMSVILGDWAHDPAILVNAGLAADVGEMQGELQRCKTILSGVLMSAGEVRGENPTITSLRHFVRDIVVDWRQRVGERIRLYDELEDDPAIVSDPALKQVIGNVIDNAREASPGQISIHARIADDALELEVCDHGPGFAPEILAGVGRPYISTKGRVGGGLGLFLVTNVARKLGGWVEVENRAVGGALVRLVIPIASLAYADTSSTDVKAGI